MGANHVGRKRFLVPPPPGMSNFFQRKRMDAPSDSLGPPWKGIANSYTGFKSKNAPERQPPARLVTIGGASRDGRGLDLALIYRTT